MIGCLRTRVRNQPIISLYFESENELTFYNPEASIDHFWSIDPGGYNLLKPSVKTAPGFEVIKLEFILRLKIKRNDWLLADTCPQPANHFALF